MYYRDQRYKTREYTEWAGQVFSQLSSVEHQTKLDNLRSEFNPEQFTYEVELDAMYPQELFFNQKGTISAKTHDLSNWEKPLIDLIFLPKYHKKSVPFGCKNLNMDDRYISKLQSTKYISNTEICKIKVKISITEFNPQLYNSDQE